MATPEPPLAPIVRMLDTVGDGSGSSAMNVNGGTTPAAFKLAPADGELFIIRRVIVTMQDNGNFPVGGFGAGAALTNGLRIQLAQSGTPVVGLDAGAIKTNEGFARVAFDARPDFFGGGGTNRLMVVRYSFDRYMAARWGNYTGPGDGLVLHGEAGDQLLVTVNDDLTGLVAFAFTAEGWRVK